MMCLPRLAEPFRLSRFLKLICIGVTPLGHDYPAQVCRLGVSAQSDSGFEAPQCGRSEGRAYPAVLELSDLYLIIRYAGHRGWT